MHKGYGSSLVCESVCLCVCVCVTALAASAYVYTAKQHAQVHVRMYLCTCNRNGRSFLLVRAVNHFRARRAAMKARIVQGTANGYSVCDTAADTIVCSHTLRSILACPRKKVCHVVCLVGSFIHRSCNMRIIGLTLVGYNYFVVYSLSTITKFHSQTPPL